MKSRVLPRRDELAVLQYVAANDPASQRTPWYGLSHGARIVRWLVSRPPRVQTIHAVRSAMEYEPPEV
jgi:alpha/beta superfamily hydrolase